MSYHSDLAKLPVETLQHDFMSGRDAFWNASFEYLFLDKIIIFLNFRADNWWGHGNDNIWHRGRHEEIFELLLLLFDNFFYYIQFF